MQNKKTKKNLLANKKETDFLEKTIAEGAQNLDALFYFIYKNYSNSKSNNSVPDLGTFIITRGTVVFTDEVEYVTLEKRPDRKMLEILTPCVPKSEEESRRIFLLNEFGDLILKFQKQAYLQVREMLLKVTDPADHQALVIEFEKYKSKLKQDPQAQEKICS